MVETKHILSAFDDDLNELFRHIAMMGGMVEEAIAQSIEALRTRDDELALRVIGNDDDIDALEEEIHRATVRILALRQPRAQDLRTVVAVIRIAISLERVGDYAKNIAKRTSGLVQSPPQTGAFASIRNLSFSVRRLLKTALDSFVRRDADLAMDVLVLDEEVDQLYNSVFRELLTHMMEDPRQITPSMHMLFIAKNLERVGDHATGIAEQVSYAVTGSLPGEERPKSDLTPFDDYSVEQFEHDSKEKRT